jgi:hypothetical protein
MAKIQASISRVQTNNTLRLVLAEDFPRDCADLPICGGWGYTQADAIVFVRKQFPIHWMGDFVPLEYKIAKKIIYEELIILRPKDFRFSGIDLNIKEQRLVEGDSRIYDQLAFIVSCWSDWHWQQLKQEWEDNDFGIRSGFDQEAHSTKRAASQLAFEREFWFDITEVFNRKPTGY